MEVCLFSREEHELATRLADIWRKKIKENGVYGVDTLKSLGQETTLIPYTITFRHPVLSHNKVGQAESREL